MLSLKVKFNEDIRRFSVSPEIAFNELHVLISKHFALAPENVQLKYIDDEEELITLGSDLELLEAKRLQPTVLRLNVYDVKPRHGVAHGPQTSKLEAVFVRDVTIPDSTSVTAGVRFSKIWCMKNSGTEPWPKGVILKMVDPKDDQLLVVAVGTINRVVAPGEETDIGVELQAPSRPGRCVQYWRLFTEDGQAFGRRLWLDITVTPASSRTDREDADEAKARSREEEERVKRADEEERQAAIERVAQEEEERERMEMLKRLQEEEERAFKEQAEQLRKKLEEEEAARKRAEEAAQLKREEEEKEARKRAEEAAQLKLEEEQREKAAQAKREEEERLRLHSKYPAQLTALADMGFTDTAHNVKTLDQHKGNLDLALESLLSGN